MKAHKETVRHYWKRTQTEVEYPEGKLLFESGTAGTYSVEFLGDSDIHIDMCGGGGKGYSGFANRKTGGSAAYIYGQINLAKGSYQVVVGASNGGSSSFNGNTAGGGGNAGSGGDGGGGTATVVSEGLTGSNGSAGSTTSRIGSYGGGGSGSANGQSGYAKIVVYKEVTTVITPATEDDYDFYTDEERYMLPTINNTFYGING